MSNTGIHSFSSLLRGQNLKKDAQLPIILLSAMADKESGIPSRHTVLLAMILAFNTPAPYRWLWQEIKKNIKI
jgi:hypothetical protein